MVYDVFPIYKGDSQNNADICREMLARKGISCWNVPEDKKDRRLTIKDMTAAIDDCKVVVLIITESTQNAGFVEKELKYAVEKGKKIFAFHLDRSDIAEKFGELASSFVTIECYRRIQEAYNELTEKIGEAVGVGIAPDVLISYKSEEKEIALNIRKKLEAVGIICWMAPESISPGNDYPFEIIAAIKKIKITVLVLSERAQDSRFVLMETERSFKYRKTIIPFHIDTSELNDSFEAFVPISQAINACGRLEDAYKELVSAVKLKLESI